MKTKFQSIKKALLVISLGLTGYANAVNCTYTLTSSGADAAQTNNWVCSASDNTSVIAIGSHPVNFISDNQIFLFTVSGNLQSNWKVSGNGSSVQLSGPGTTFSDGGFIFTVDSVIASDSTTLIFSYNNVASTLGSLNLLPGSTVNYTASSGIQAVIPAIYSNLVISGTASIQLIGYTEVDSTLTINTGCALAFNGNQELFLGGTIAGGGTITGNNSAQIIISSYAANFGTINFTNGHQFLNAFGINCGSVNTVVTLGSNLTIIDDGNNGSYFDLNMGTLNLNGNTLTTDSTCQSIYLPDGSDAGLFTGSLTSSIHFNSLTSQGFGGGNLWMDQSIPGVTNSLSCLTLNDHGSGSSLFLGGTLNIVDSICPTSGYIDGSFGNLNLMFTDSVKTGRVGVIGNMGGIWASVTSNIQRPRGNAGWNLMGYPGIIPSPSNFGVYEGQFSIECPTCPDGNTFTSVNSWNESAAVSLSDNNGYKGINSITDTANIGIGYWFYMGTAQTGTLTNLPTTPDSIIPAAAVPISVTGQVLSAAGSGFSMNLTSNHTGYNLLANPVPSPISWASLRAENPNVSTSYYVYSPNYNGGSYVLYDEITGTDASGLLSDIISQGQGFYAVAVSNTTLTCFESNKRNGGTQGLARLSGNPIVQSSGVNFFKLIVTNSSNQVNSATFEFNPNALNGRDIYDAPKMPTRLAKSLQVSSSSYGTDLVINANPALTQNYSIPVKIISGTTGSYQINTINLNNMPVGGCIVLHDNYTNADYDLRAGGFNVTINDTETVARFVLKITITPLNIVSDMKQTNCNNANNGFIIAGGNDAGPWNYIWKNASGTIVKTTMNKATADTLNGLNNGVYSVTISTIGTCNSATQTFTLTAPSSPVSAFTAPSIVSMGSTINFANNSTDATNYIWNFGDGGISSQQLPTYVYNNPGTYTITLDAIIASCNDTVSSTQVIQVEATTGIKQVNGSTGIILSRDGLGNYLQFDYSNETKVNIVVYNLLGQTLLNNSGLMVSNDKIYLNINDNKNQVLYATITNLTNNEQITKKFNNE